MEIDPIKYQHSWRKRVDTNMVYYIALLIMFSILNVVYKFPLSEAKGFVAKIFRDQWPGDIMQITACYTQLIIIMGLCMDGGTSLTGQQINQEFTAEKNLTLQCHFFMIPFWPVAISLPCGDSVIELV